MNLVVLQRGEAVFQPAGVLHAYIAGLGVELMAASDNVLRGGLTPKHIDVDELLAVLVTTPGPPPVLAPEELGAGLQRFAADGIPDFALLHTAIDGDAEISLEGVAIALVTTGEVDVEGAASGAHARRIPGWAVRGTPDEGIITARGAGDLFIATPGSPSA